MMLSFLAMTLLLLSWDPPLSSSCAWAEAPLRGRFPQDLPDPQPLERHTHPGNSGEVWLGVCDPSRAWPQGICLRLAHPAEIPGQDPPGQGAGAERDQRHIRQVGPEPGAEREVPAPRCCHLLHQGTQPLHQGCQPGEEWRLANLGRASPFFSNQVVLKTGHLWSLFSEIFPFCIWFVSTMILLLWHLLSQEEIPSSERSKGLHYKDGHLSSRLKWRGSASGLDKSSQNLWWKRPPCFVNGSYGKNTEGGSAHGRGPWGSDQNCPQSLFYLGPGATCGPWLERLDRMLITKQWALSRPCFNKTTLMEAYIQEQHFVDWHWIFFYELLSACLLVIGKI